MTNAQRIERVNRIKAEAPRLRDCGYSVSAIAVYFNVPVQSVHRALRIVGRGKWKWSKNKAVSA